MAMSVLFVTVITGLANEDQRQQCTPKSSVSRCLMKATQLLWLKSWLKSTIHVMEEPIYNWKRRKKKIVKQHLNRRATEQKLRARMTVARRFDDNPRPTRRGRVLTALACSTLVMSADATQNKRTNEVTFDTDAGLIGIDNRCSRCISHVVDDFVGPPRDSNRVIKGHGGSRTTGVKVGTIKWKWEDDAGAIHTHLMPNSCHAPPTPQCATLGPNTKRLETYTRNRRRDSQ